MRLRLHSGRFNPHSERFRTKRHPPKSVIFQIKCQEHAEKFRNLQMASVSKNADIKRRLTISYLRNAVICTKAPSTKTGAGGARAARRIRIHIWRPLWTMCVASVASATERSLSLQTYGVLALTRRRWNKQKTF